MKAKKKKTSMLLVCFLLLTLLVGCTNESSMEGKKIELKEPVTAAVNSEKAMLRTIRDAKIFTGFVFPETEEYAFSEAVNVKKSNFFPGEAVEKGDILVNSDSTDFDKKIKKAQKNLEESKEDYENKQTTRAKELEAVKQKLNQAGKSSVEREILQYKKSALEREMEEAQKLFELSYSYEEQNIQKQINAVSTGSVSAQKDGVVVAIGGVSQGNGRYNQTPSLTSYYANWGQPVIAVANTNKLHIQCEYVENKKINQAKDYYALINGERIEVEHVPIGIDEYNDRMDQNGVVYSTFLFREEPKNISVGDFVCLILVNDSNDDVVSVSNNCIRKDATGNYVYVIENGKSIYTPVKIGLRDSNFTAVLSGLSAGAEVLGVGGVEHGNETILTKRGNFVTEYSGEGTILFPNITPVYCEIKYGTINFQNAKVSLFQYVKKGDILASVTVSIDEAEMQKEKTQLERLEARMEDFLLAGTTGKELELAQKEKELLEQRNLVDQMNKDAVTTKIIAPKDGIVVSMNQYFQNGKLTEGTEIAQIADTDACYILATNNNQQLTLGNEVDVIYRTAQNKEVSVKGQVVSLSKMGLSTALSSNFAFVKIPKEDILDLSAGIMNSWGLCEIKANIREMKNVIVIPKQAVTEVSGTAYVHIKNADGSITTQSIVAGGYNAENYWVADGLWEGMELCLK